MMSVFGKSYSDLSKDFFSERDTGVKKSEIIQPRAITPILGYKKCPFCGQKHAYFLKEFKKEGYLPLFWYHMNCDDYELIIAKAKVWKVKYDELYFNELDIYENDFPILLIPSKERKNKVSKIKKNNNTQNKLKL